MWRECVDVLKINKACRSNCGAKPTWRCSFRDPSERANLAQLERCLDLMAAVCMPCPRPAQSDQQPANPNACYSLTEHCTISIHSPLWQRQDQEKGKHSQNWPSSDSGGCSIGRKAGIVWGIPRKELCWSLEWLWVSHASEFPSVWESCRQELKAALHA